MRVVCGGASGSLSPHHPKIMDSNGRHTSVSSTSTNSQPIKTTKKANENQTHNGSSEKIGRHRPAGASAMNARDHTGKQKLGDIAEPGPLKRAQGKFNHHTRTLPLNCFILRFN